jgi:hypothetical protein
MHGLGRGLRQAILYAKPWQRYVLIGIVIALGLALVAVGHFKGLILVAIGVFTAFEVIHYRGSSSRDDEEGPEHPDEE